MMILSHIKIETYKIYMSQLKLKYNIYRYNLKKK